ncbi:conserved hypothetical protein [Trichinella spiralis]|uniref:hypothetical protein n=1 Tax=Trichinella spiralis TaxID=6334 RepID=UPI0001EFEF7C|nr:conserved hypothetical protein [Trichinella spiralis]
MENNFYYMNKRNKLALSDIRSVEFTWKFNAMCKRKVNNVIIIVVKFRTVCN